MKTPRTDAVVQPLRNPELSYRELLIYQLARELEIENIELQSTINTLHNLCVSAEKRALEKVEAERAAIDGSAPVLDLIFEDTSTGIESSIAYCDAAEKVLDLYGNLYPLVALENQKASCVSVAGGIIKATLLKPRPKIITICGSSRFVAESAVKAWELNKQGIATFYMPLLPQWYPGVQEHHQAEAEGVAANLDNLWLELISMSDEIFVVNCAIPGHENGYIGQRTRIEINHALKIGKPVRYLVEQNSD